MGLVYLLSLQVLKTLRVVLCKSYRVVATEDTATLRNISSFSLDREASSYTLILSTQTVIKSILQY